MVDAVQVFKDLFNMAKQLRNAVIREEIWSNPDITQNFEIGTYNFDLSDADFVEVELLAAKGYSNRYYNCVPVGYTSMLMAYTSDWFGWRNITVTKTGIKFGDGGYRYYSGATGASVKSTGYGIPDKIYKVKRMNLGGGS